MPTRTHPTDEDCKECEKNDAPRVPEPVDARTSAKQSSEWYGWQILLADAGSMGLMIAGLNLRAGSGVPFVVGGVGYLAGGPIIHGVHGRGGAAGASIGLRLGLVVGGAGVGGVAEQCHESESRDIPCGLVGAVIGSFAGALIASIIDSAALAYGDSAPPRRPQTGVSVTPTVSASRHSGTVGVAGAF